MLSQSTPEELDRQALDGVRLLETTPDDVLRAQLSVRVPQYIVAIRRAVHRHVDPAHLVATVEHCSAALDVVDHRCREGVSLLARVLAFLALFGPDGAEYLGLKWRAELELALPAAVA